MSGGLQAGGPRLGFAAEAVTRDFEARTDESAAAALAHPGARLLLTGPDGRFLFEAGDPRFSPEAARRHGADLSRPGDLLLLGTDETGAPLFAAGLAAPPAATPDKGAASADLVMAGGTRPQTFDLRSVAMAGLVAPSLESAMGLAQHLANWHAQNRFCGRCGAPSVPERGGARRVCTACGTLRFPRTDPVTIMLVHDGAGSCVLGRQPRFPPGMWSCLAGFVEPAETIEAAVRRETLEEAGLVVGEVAYLTSQPWPFPGSLMIGCIGRTAPGGRIAFDRTELEDCRWFGRDEVVRMLAGTHPDGLQAPQPFAIAHHLLLAFAEGRA